MQSGSSPVDPRLIADSHRQPTVRTRSASQPNPPRWVIGSASLGPGVPADGYTAEGYVCDHILESAAD